MSVDWKAACAGFTDELLNKPPYVVLKGVDKPPKRLPRTADELMYYRERDPRLQNWLRYEANNPSFRPVPTNHWPDSLEEWDEEIEKLVNDGTVPHKGAAYDYMYENNEDFKTHADRGFEIQKACDSEWRKKWLFYKLNRAIWTVVWCARIARKLTS